MLLRDLEDIIKRLDSALLPLIIDANIGAEEERLLDLLHERMREIRIAGIRRKSVQGSIHQIARKFSVGVDEIATIVNDPTPLPYHTEACTLRIIYDIDHHADWSAIRNHFHIDKWGGHIHQTAPIKGTVYHEGEYPEEMLPFVNDFLEGNLWWDDFLEKLRKDFDTHTGAAVAYDVLSQKGWGAISFHLRSGLKRGFNFGEFVQRMSEVPGIVKIY